MKSKELKNQLKDQLESIMYDIDNIYHSLEEELHTEIIQKKENIEKIDEETNKLYGLYLSGNKENALKLLRKSLPLRVKLFNKINWSGHGIYESGKYIIWFYFNDDSMNYFSKIFTVREIKEIFKYKE